jgi:hypothetical protein
MQSLLLTLCIATLRSLNRTSEVLEIRMTAWYHAEGWDLLLRRHSPPRAPVFRVLQTQVSVTGDHALS